MQSHRKLTDSSEREACREDLMGDVFYCLGETMYNQPCIDPSALSSTKAGKGGLSSHTSLPVSQHGAHTERVFRTYLWTGCMI